MASPSQTSMDPVNAALDKQVKDAADLARRLLARPTWRCNDGHTHPRPEEFTRRRLINEMLKAPEASRWNSTSIGSLGVWALVDSGELVIGKNLMMRKGLA